MGGRGSQYLRLIKIPPPQQPQPPQPQPPQQVAPPAPPPPPPVDANDPFAATDSAPFHELKGGAAYYQQQNLDIDTRTAIQDYLDPNTTPGSLYNFAQNMNYAVQQNQKLNAQQQFAWDSIVGSMHNLGQNLTLTRYDHIGAVDDMLAQVGVVGGSRGMTVGQIKQLLTGHTFTDNRILSTTHNDFRNAANASTFTTREVKIEYRAKASTQALMPGNGPGGKLGEMLLAPTGTKGHNGYKVVDVKLSGQKARAKGSPVTQLNRQQILIVVDVE